MTKTRLEAFSDGVIAILITIMVLELRIPHGDGFDSLSPLWPVFVTYILSFVNLEKDAKKKEALVEQLSKLTKQLADTKQVLDIEEGAQPLQSAARHSRSNSSLSCPMLAI